LNVCAKIKIFNELIDDFTLNETFELINRITYLFQKNKNTLFIVLHGSDTGSVQIASKISESK